MSTTQNALRYAALRAILVLQQHNPVAAGKITDRLQPIDPSSFEAVDAQTDALIAALDANEQAEVNFPRPVSEEEFFRYLGIIDQPDAAMVAESPQCECAFCVAERESEAAAAAEEERLRDDFALVAFDRFMEHHLKPESATRTLAELGFLAYQAADNAVAAR